MNNVCSGKMNEYITFICLCMDANIITKKISYIFVYVFDINRITRQKT